MKLSPLFERDICDLYQARRDGTGPRYHVRFLVAGQALQVGTCRLLPKGANVIYHPVYWNVPQAFIDLAVARVQKRNPGVQVRTVTELATDD